MTWIKSQNAQFFKSPYHGNSLSLIQFPSTVNFGEERYYDKNAKVLSTGNRKAR